MADEPRCFRCQTPLSLPEGPVGRRESCPACGTDIRVCYNCAHYDLKAYNECREPQAERVVDKDRSNFCDYFLLGRRDVAARDAKEETLKQLDSLFKTK